MERACRPLCGLRVGAASCEDKNRLLQRCEPAWRLPEPVVRFSRLQFPGEEDDVARSYPRARLHARRQPKGAEGHQPSNPALDPSPPQRQIPAGTSQDVQPVHSRLDQLLRQLLSDAAASNPEEDRYLCHPLGAPEVQAVASPNQRGAGLVCAAALCKSEALRSLAAMSWKRPNNGSRMNREVHVRFWESPEVKVLQATRHQEPPRFATGAAGAPQ